MMPHSPLILEENSYSCQKPFASPTYYPVVRKALATVVYPRQNVEKLFLVWGETDAYRKLWTAPASPTGCSNGPSSRAAASEEAKRTLLCTGVL
jgi:hypothetical protein